MTRRAGIPAQSHYRRLPADERVLVQPDERLSRAAVYAGVNARARCCANYLSQLLGYPEAMPWHKGQSGNPGGLSKGSPGASSLLPLSSPQR